MAKIFITPLAIIVAFLLSGVIIQKVVFRYLSKLAQKTPFKWDDIIIDALKSFIIFWLFLAGINAALPFMDLRPSYIRTISVILQVAFIFTFMVSLVKMVSGFAVYYTRERSGLQSTTIFINLLKISIIVLGVLLILQSLGIKITPLITALGVGGLAVALALQDTLSNLFAGLHIIFSGQIRVGDFVKLDSGQKGEIIDITWRNSTIMTRGNNIIVVPNSKMAQAIVLNFNLNKKEVVVRVPVGVAYDSDLEKVEKVTLEVAGEVMREVEGGVKDFEPKVRFHTFNDFSIDMTVILRAKEYMDQYLIKHEFVKRLHKKYNQERIEIPFPIRTIEFKKK